MEAGLPWLFLLRLRSLLLHRIACEAVGASEAENAFMLIVFLNR